MITDICDFHAHILPGADHGSDSLKTSLRQLSLAKKFGVNRIIATPHFYPHEESIESFIKRRNAAYSLLECELTSDLPTVKLGAEVLICPKIEEIPSLEKLCIQGTRTLLIELPFNDFSKEYFSSVKELIKHGYKVVLAHAERYESDIIESLVKLGAVIQINAYSITRFFKNCSIESWKNRKLIYAIGSDIHGADYFAYAKFAKARKKLSSYLLYLKTKSDEIWNEAE